MHPKKLLPFISSVFFISCTTTTPNHRTPANGPYDGVLRPNVSDHDSESNLLNFQLTPQEQWNGSTKENEINAFKQDAQSVREASSTLVKKFGEPTPRVFHQKSHGCATGVLRFYTRDERKTALEEKIRNFNDVFPQKPVDKSIAETAVNGTLVGLFNNETDENGNKVEFPLIARFSNGVGFSEHDLLPDVRGLGLKIFYSENDSVDFLMTNATNPLGRDHRQFVQFMNENVKGNLQTGAFFISEDRKQAKQAKKNSDQLVARELPYFTHFSRSVLGAISSPQTEKYWSGHPYLMGQDQHMKFNVQPANWTWADEAAYEGRAKLVQKGLKNFFSKKNAVYKNYLRERLAEAMNIGSVKYVMNVQLFKDNVSTPVENTLVEWHEADTISIPVAEIIFDKQDINASGRDEACTALRFTPGHYHPEHRPSGNMGRGRLFSYLASQKQRKSNAVSPKRTIVEQWRNNNYGAGSTGN